MMSVLSRRIRALRRDKGWGLGELASRAGISPTALDQIEQGHTTDPQPETLQQISRALEMPLELLIDASPHPADDAAEEPVVSAAPAGMPPPYDSPGAGSPAQSNTMEHSSSAATFDESNFPVVNTEAWGVMNHRRAELIRKKNRQGLTDAEQVEYDRLQSLSFEALEWAFPRPESNLDELVRLEERLRAEVERP